MKICSLLFTVVLTMMGSANPVFSSSPAPEESLQESPAPEELLPEEVYEDLHITLERSVVSEMFNGIVGFLLPTFNNAVQRILELRFDPYNLEMSAREQIFGLPLICSPKAVLTYDAGLMTGLSKLKVERFQMVPGSEFLNGNPLGNASFGSIIDFVGTIDSDFDLKVDLLGDLKFEICGFGPKTAVNGSLGLKGATFHIESMIGGFINMLKLKGSLTDFAMNTFKFDYEDLDISFDRNFTFEGRAEDSIRRNSERIPAKLRDPMKQVVEEVANTMIPLEFGL